MGTKRRSPESGCHVALLRGINVGKAKRISMDDLRKLCEGLGFRDVRTLLQSGNVVFRAPRSRTTNAASRIERALETKAGVSARVIVLSAADLTKIVRENTLVGIADDPSRLLVSVLREPADREFLKPLESETWAPDALAVGSRAAYLWCKSGILESRLAEEVASILRDRTTARNWSTISKLHALATGGT